MKKKIILLLFNCCFAIVAFGQEAKLSAVFTDIISDKRRSELKEIEFKINEQVFRFGSSAITIKPIPNRIDTLFYRSTKKSVWDTILCNFQKPYTYTITYNVCCEGFNISSKDIQCGMPDIIFKIKRNRSQKTYMGSYEATGILITKRKRKLTSICNHSAMASTIQLLEFSEVMVCNDSSNCEASICLFEKNKNDHNYNFQYQTLSKKLSHLIMPLGEKKMRILYNPINGKIKIR